MTNKMNLYRLEDERAEKFGPTFEAQNNAVAFRSVMQMQITTPEDYTLHWVATIDDETADVITQLHPEFAQGQQTEITWTLEEIMQTEANKRKKRNEQLSMQQQNKE